MSYGPLAQAASAVIFDASSGTPTISRAFNATITDDGVGLFTVNFAAAFASAEYVMVGNCRNSGTVSAVWAETLYRRDTTAAKAAGSCRIKTTAGGGIHNDYPEVNAAFYGYQ